MTQPEPIELEETESTDFDDEQRPERRSDDKDPWHGLSDFDE